MDDELQEVRDNFYVGNFQKAQSLAESVAALNDVTQSERDAIIGRCYLSLQQFDKLKTLQNSPVPGQRAAAMMAILTMSRKEEQKQAARDRLLELAKESQDFTTAMLAASVVAQSEDMTEALALTSAHPTVEMQALRVFLFLRMNRTDLAERQLRDMASLDDSGASRLAQAAAHLGTGNAEEAYLVYSDLSSQFPCEGEDGSSALLQTSKAVANMQRGMFTEALEDLQFAAQAAPNDPDVLVNLCCCYTHLARKEDFQTTYAKLEQAHPSHPYVVKTQSIKNAFTRFKGA